MPWCMRLLAWLSVTLLVGCSTGHPLALSTQDSSSRTTGAVSPSAPIAAGQQGLEPAGTRSAQDIGARIIRLAQNLNSLDDISPTSIERHTGLRVEFNKHNRLKYGFGGLIAEPWHYDLDSVQEAEGSMPRQLIFFLRQRGHEGKADMTPICKPSFQEYRNALVEAGYQSKRIPLGYNWIGLGLSRGTIHIQLIPQRKADPDDPLACLFSMRLTVLNHQNTYGGNKQ